MNSGTLHQITTGVKRPFVETLNDSLVDIIQNMGNPVPTQTQAKKAKVD